MYDTGSVPHDPSARPRAAASLKNLYAGAKTPPSVWSSAARRVVQEDFFKEDREDIPEPASATLA
jgi:hypothetical protein